MTGELRVRLYDDAKTATLELGPIVLGQFCWGCGNDARAGEMNLPGVLVRSERSHIPNHTTQRELDIVEAVALAIKDDNLVRAELVQASHDFLVELNIVVWRGAGWRCWRCRRG